MDRLASWLMVVSVILGTLLLLSALGQWTSGYGGLQNQVDNVGEEQTEMRQEMNVRFQQVENRFQTLEDRLTEEIRLSKKDIIVAISEHAHEEETGVVVFHTPPLQ